MGASQIARFWKTAIVDRVFLFCIITRVPKEESPLQAILLGILASLFFAVTFVLNRSMELGGGSWIWSASLRYFFMVPFLLFIVAYRRNLMPLLRDMASRPLTWLLWSTIGFGLFYAPMTFAATYGPAWLVAGTWQLTIVAGSLLVPLFYETVQTPEGPVTRRQQIPVKGLLMSLIILFGIALMQAQHAADGVTAAELALGILPVLVAAFAYPFGNRKMMTVLQGRFDVFQRVLGMTLASLPFWFLLSFYGLGTVGAPSGSQALQSLIVAISSGVIATILFFSATDRVKDSAPQLAAVEATQAGAVVFTMIGEVLVLNGNLPSGLSMLGIALVIIGMILHSYVSRPTQKTKLTRGASSGPQP